MRQFHIPSVASVCCVFATAAAALLHACRTQPLETETLRPDWEYREEFNGLHVALDVWEPGGTGPDNRWFRLSARSGAERQQATIDCPYDGKITGHWVADLDGNTRPEVVLFETSFGTGAYGILSIYEWTGDGLRAGDTSAWTVRLPGYRGHDTMQIVDRTIRREYPLYRDNDANSGPTGGTVVQTFGYSEGRIVLLSSVSRPPGDGK